MSLCTDWRQTSVATVLVIDTGVWGGGVKFGSVSRNIPRGEGEIDRKGGKETERDDDDIDLQIFSIFLLCVQTRGMSNVAFQK